MALNRKQRRFVTEYLKDQNGAQAAIRAGYSKRSARQIAQRLLTKDDLRAELHEKYAKIEAQAECTVEFILDGLREVAKRCLQRVPVMIRDPRDGRKFIQKEDENGEGIWEFDSNGANRALELLGKYRKMFSERIEHSGTLTLEQLLAGSWDKPVTSATNGDRKNGKNNNHLA